MSNSIRKLAPCLLALVFAFRAQVFATRRLALLPEIQPARNCDKSSFPGAGKGLLQTTAPLFRWKSFVLPTLECVSVLHPRERCSRPRQARVLLRGRRNTPCTRRLHPLKITTSYQNSIPTQEKGLRAFHGITSTWKAKPLIKSFYHQCFII